MRDTLFEWGIKWRLIRPGAPHFNGKVERARRTDLEEFRALAVLARLGLADELGEYQHYYNWYRTHGSLGKTAALLDFLANTFKVGIDGLYGAHVQDLRNGPLIRQLLSDGASRLARCYNLVLMTDGDANYASLFPEIFGQPYHPRRQGSRGRLPQVRFRIPRTLAHVQIIKRRPGRRVVQVDIRSTPALAWWGSQSPTGVGLTGPYGIP